MNGEELAGNRSSRSSWFRMFQTKTDKWLPNKAKNIRIDLWESKKKTCNCMHEAVQNILWESTLFWTTAKSSEIVKQLELNLLEANKLKKKIQYQDCPLQGAKFQKAFSQESEFFFFFPSLTTIRSHWKQHHMLMNDSKLFLPFFSGFSLNLEFIT